MTRCPENIQLAAGLPGDGFLAALPAELREVLSCGADPAIYPRGSTIHSPGSKLRPGVVVTGLVRAYVTADDGREATVRYVYRGDAFGLADIFVADPALGLQALSETTVLYFDESQVSHAVANDVGFVRALAGHLAAGSGSSSEAFRMLAFGRVRERVAAHLLSLATCDDHGRLVAQVTQQALADAVGSVRDVVARELRELSTAGLVVTSHGKVLVTDEDGLKREAA
jgi:CRP/FNR family transcriptional regulator, cyclic AMP receptor protein